MGAEHQINQLKLKKAVLLLESYPKEFVKMAEKATVTLFDQRQNDGFFFFLKIDKKS
jgi:hypothetical protein